MRDRIVLFDATDEPKSVLAAYQELEAALSSIGGGEPSAETRLLFESVASRRT